MEEKRHNKVRRMHISLHLCYFPCNNILFVLFIHLTDISRYNPTCMTAIFLNPKRSQLHVINLNKKSHISFNSGFSAVSMPVHEPFKADVLSHQLHS